MMVHHEETGVLGVARLSSLAVQQDNILRISNFEGGVFSSNIQKTVVPQLLLVRNLSVRKYIDPRPSRLWNVGAYSQLMDDFPHPPGRDQINPNTSNAYFFNLFHLS